MNIEIKQTPNTGPPFWIRWVSFIGWLVLPILATWVIVIFSGLVVLWWGVVWFGFALFYTIAYFRWARRRYPKT